MKPASHCQRIFLLAAVTIAGISPTRPALSAFAQVAPSFTIGDVVEVDPQLTHQWSTANVTSVNILQGRLYGYAVRIESGPAGAGNVLHLSPAHFRRSTTVPAQDPPTEQTANGQFRVGDMVQADFFGTGHWIKGKIDAVYPAQGPVIQYTVEDASTPGARGAVNQLAPGNVRPWTDGTAQPAQLAAPTQVTNPNPAPIPAHPAAQQPGQFKVGDRVLSSINSATGEYQPCTIMGPLNLGTYPVRCDPFKGRPYTDWGAFPQFIKPWPGATPAPKVQACSFSVPGGTVSRNSPPTTQTFQRVIYAMAAVSERGRFGMTFTRFQIGRPYRNGVIQSGAGGVEMERRQAPEGAIIYPITSEYVRCVNVDAGYDERTVVEVNWACMKNNDGDWDCPTNSTAEVIRRERVPN